MYTDENTTEFVAWQTKSTDLLNNRRPMPFIAPHHSFTGIPWWRTLVEGVKAIIALNDNRDFLMAPPTMDHTGIRAIPITSSQSLLWYRAILVMGGLDQATALKQTLSGLRVFMADLAYQDAQNTLGYTAALQAESQAAAGYQMAVSAHRLNILAAFFFPMATLSAIFGVNLQTGLEQQSAPLPFLALVSISVICGFVLKGFIASEAPKPPSQSITASAPSDR